MTKLTKRSVNAAEVRAKDYVIWDDELPSFGLRVFAFGRRSYVIQYRARGRSRRYTIGKHGVWTAETARREAKVLLGRIARGGNPAEQKLLDREAMTVSELCKRYRLELEKGLILGKGDRPKKPSTISTDIGRIDRHILPLLGNRRVKDLTAADINRAMKDIMAGKTRVSVKTGKLRGRSRLKGESCRAISWIIVKFDGQGCINPQIWQLMSRRQNGGSSSQSHWKLPVYFRVRSSRSTSSSNFSRCSSSSPLAIASATQHAA